MVKSVLFFNAMLFCGVLLSMHNDLIVKSSTKINNVTITSDQEDLEIAFKKKYKGEYDLIRLYGVPFVLNTKLEKEFVLHWISEYREKEDDAKKAVLIDVATLQIMAPLIESSDNRNS